MEPSSEGQIALEIQVSFVLFKSSDSDYAVIKGYDSSKKQICIAGNLGKPYKGDIIKVSGNWTTHPKFGRQFAGNRDNLDSQSDPTMKILLNHCKKAGIIDAKFLDYIKSSIPDFLTKVILNPYMLLDSSIHATWIIVDKLAESIGFMPDSDIRISSAIRHTMRNGKNRDLKKDLESSAGCWATPESLLPEASKLLGLSVNQILEILSRSNPPNLTAIQTPTVAIMDSKIADAEVTIAQKSQEILKSNGPSLIGLPPFSKGLSEQQATAAFLALNSGISCIIGKPGVGKTRVAAEIARLSNATGQTVFLAAPTGKAALRMAESVLKYNLDGRETTPIYPHQTIHRLLSCIPTGYGGFTFAYNAGNTLPPGTYLIDEGSMIPTELFGNFMEAIGPDSRIIFFGDINQIPPVSAGQPFQDLIESGSIPVHELTQIFRQAEGSAIAEACEIVLNGEAHQLFSFLRSDRARAEIEYIPVQDDSEFNRLIPGIYSEMGEDKIALCPMNKNLGGSIEINKAIQHSLNRHREAFRVHEELSFHLMDPVIQVRNNYNRDGQKGIFNGDIGFVSGIGSSKKSILDVLFPNRQIPEEYSKTQAMSELKLAYAISIHRFQGSESENVLLALPSASRGFLTRKLLYTGMSRAKKKLKLVANPLAIQAAMGKVDSNNPIRTRLGSLLTEYKLPD